MLELLTARARSEGLDIQARVMDGHALHLDDASFDVAGSQFGVMLFPDMPRGIREMARVVVPGGRVLVTAYGDPHKIDFLAFFVRAVQSVRPDFDGPPPEPPPLPFQLQDPARLQQVARRRLAAECSRGHRDRSHSSFAAVTSCGTGSSGAIRSSNRFSASSA